MTEPHATIAAVKMSRVHERIEGFITIEPAGAEHLHTSITFTANSYAAANVAITCGTDDDIDQAIDTACMGLAARLHSMYREQRRRELERRGELAQTVDAFAQKHRP